MRVKINETFSIDVNKDSYDVIKFTKVEDPESKNFGVVNETALHFCTSMSNALEKVIKLGLADQDKEVDLLEYITILNQIIGRMKQFVDIKI